VSAGAGVVNFSLSNKEEIAASSMKESGCLLKPFLNEEFLSGHLKNGERGRNNPIASGSMIISSSESPNYSYSL